MCSLCCCRQEYSYIIFSSSRRGSYLTYDEWPGRARLSHSRTLWQENLLVAGLCSLLGFTVSKACVCELCVSSICGAFLRTHTAVNSLIRGPLMSAHMRSKTNRWDFCVTLGEIYSDVLPSAGANALIVSELIMHKVSKRNKAHRENYVFPLADLRVTLLEVSQQAKLRYTREEIFLFAFFLLFSDSLSAKGSQKHPHPLFCFYF